jgi:hypothetical protein
MKTMTTLGVLALLLLALPAAAQINYDWSNVGSVAILQAGTGAVTTGPTFTFAASRTGTITGRFNVTNTYSGAQDKTPPWTTLSFAYTDNSSLGNVTLRLYEVDKCSNAEQQICEITSTDNGSCDVCVFGAGAIDFANNVYYIQANINRTSTAANIALHSVAIN